MKKYLFLCIYLLGLITHLHCSSSREQQDSGDEGNSRSETLSVSSVTRSTTGQSLYGSVLGGTDITISGYGFDRSDPENNKVFIGNYPCNVKQATRQKIICQTPQFINSIEPSQTTSLSVKVMVGRASVTSVQYSYSTSYTPIIRKVYPTTIFGSTPIKIWGIHRMNLIGDGNRVPGEIFKISLNNTVCGRTGYNFEYLSFSDWRFLGCTMQYTMEAGRYNLSYWVSHGYAYHQNSIRKWNMYRNQSYQLTILPLINKISPPSGTGQILTINGTGFVSDSSRVKVEVDGRICEIRQAQSNRIQCRLNQRRQGSTSRLLTNTTGTQKMGYIAGSGWNYTRYGRFYDGEIKNVRGFVAGLTQTPSIQGIKAELQTGSHVTLDTYLDVYKGYFKAPRSGSYRFKGFGQRKFALFLSNVYGSVQMNTNQTPIIWSNSQTLNQTHITIMVDKIISNEIYMQEGKYYYMELYHTHQPGSWIDLYVNVGGHLKISVQIPNNDTSIPGEVYAVHRFITKFTPDPQIVQFTQQGASGGTLVLSLARQDSSFRIVYSFSMTIAYNEPIQSFLNKLRGCSGYSEYRIDGERQVYDQSGNNITSVVDDGDQSQAYRYVWRVSIYYKRPATHIAQRFEITYNIIGSQYFNQEIVQDFSPLISGTFKIQIGGLILPQPTNTSAAASNNTNVGFAYDVSAADVQAALRRIQGLGSVKVKRDGDPHYTANWTIFYQKYTAIPPEPTFITDNLQGGSTGTSPTIQLLQLQPYKTNINIDIINHQFLFQPSQKPKVLITVDNYLMSVCSDCSYVYNQAYPKITAIAFVASNPLVNFTLNVSAGFNVNISGITITEKNTGSECVITRNQSLPTFKCLLDTNQDSSPRLYAGPVIFQVFVSGIGYVQINSAISLSTNLIVSSLTPSQGSMHGGYNITILGRGFHDNNPNLINITMCNQRAQILQATNIKIIFRAPSCNQSGNSTVYVQSGVYSNDASIFSYLPPEPTEIPIIISSITPASANPTLKIPLKINGSGFGNNSQLLTVTINRNDGLKNYKLKILKLVNDTYMQVGFPGSLAGKYKLNIKKIQNSSVILSRAQTTNSDILTIGVFITSVTPSTGSPFGGTQITIQGQNFSPFELDTIVNIGQKPNTFCELLSFTSTIIRCRTPPQPDAYFNQSQTVYVTTKITQDAYCANQVTRCQFEYIDLVDYTGPTIVKVINNNNDTYRLAVQNVTLKTTNRTAWSQGFEIMVKNAVTGKIHIVPTYISLNQTHLNFTLPQIQSGLYQILLWTSSGYSNSVYIKRSLSSSTNTFYMTQRGGAIIISGIGLPEDINTKIFKFSYQYNNYPVSIKYEILNTSPTSMELLISTPNFVNTLQSGTLKIQGPFETVSIQLYFYQIAVISNTITYNTSANGNTNFLISNTSVINRVRIVSKSVSNIFYDITNFTYSNSKINFTCSLSAGAYNIWVNINQTNVSYKGWYNLSMQVNVTRPNITLNQMRLGKKGALLELPNTPFISNTTTIKLNGQIAKYHKKILNNTYFYIPPYIQQRPPTPTPTPPRNIIDLLRASRYQFSYISDLDRDSRSGYGSSVYDYDRRDSYNSMNSICYTGINVTSVGVGFRLKEIYIQIPQNHQDEFRNSSFQGSTDGITWQRIISMPTQTTNRRTHFRRQDYDDDYQRQVREYNDDNNPGFVTPPINISTRIYRAIRTVDRSGRSRCRADYIVFKGQLAVIYDNVTNNTNNTNNTNSTDVGPFNIEIDDGYNRQIIPNIAIYSDQATPTITDISPRTGHYLGGYNLTITGTNLQGNINIYIDTIPCTLISQNQTTIICQVQQRPQGIISNSFDVLVNGNYADIQVEDFKYVMRWSDQKTWGMSFKPVDGDLIYVPKGQVLWVDQSTPKLLGIVVEGKIIFSDQRPMTITTDFITINKGQFIAGTLEKPYQNFLNFKLTGWARTPRQPIFGTKVIGCEACKFSMHAKGRANFRWSQLNTTISPNSHNIRLKVPVPDTYANSVNGAKVVVTSTSHNFRQMQVLTLLDTSAGGLYTAQPFTYKHLSTTIDNKPISAQAGLLSSNIIIQGVDSYQTQKFGAKIIMRGQQNIDNSYLQISNIQITKCGQPQIYNQHCITILNSGSSGNSYIKNSSIHNTYSRGIHFSNQIIDFVVQGNVIVNTTGHGIQFQSMFATNNVIRNNLILNAKPSWQMTQKDATAAAIHLMGTLNILQDNHLAGGQYFGIWYDLKDNYQGNFYAYGMKYNPNTYNNYIHGFNYAGLFIDKLSWTYNTYYQSTNSPSYPTKLKSYILYHNNYGLYIPQSNYITITQSLLIQNQIHISLKNARINKNSSSIINTSFYGTLDNTITPISGQIFVQLPCSSSFNISLVNFSNLNNSNSVILQGCQPESYWYTSTDQVFVSMVRYSYFSCTAVQFRYDRLNLIYDTDGTFTQNTIIPNNRLLMTQSPSSMTIIPILQHLLDPSCFQSDWNTNTTTLTWQNTRRCNSSVKVRKMYFTRQTAYWESGLRIGQIPDFMYNGSVSWYYLAYRGQNHQIPFIMNKYYEIYRERIWQYDFTFMSLQMVGVFEPGDGTIVFKHTYIKSRQLFQVKLYQSGTLSTTQNNTQTGLPLNISTCNIGDYYHDNNQSLFGVCLSDRNMRPKQTINVYPIFCRYQCPAQQEQQNDGGCAGIPETRFRLWSNASMWPNSTLPGQGANVTIKKQWKVILDMNPPKMDYFYVLGTLIIPDQMNQTLIEANMIWVKGSLKAGNSSLPYYKNLTIKINGGMNNFPMNVDVNEQGNKMIVVTGLLSLYGNPPSTVWTKLTQTAFPTNTTIQVIRNIGWNIGDQLVISPSFTNTSQSQYIKITNIVGNTITFQPALNFTHYGASGVTTQQRGQEIDARAIVGHLTRNIKIVSGNSTSWGYRILTYGYLECDAPKIGVLKLSGVQLVNGGQPFPIYAKPRPTIHLKRLTLGQVRSQILSSSIHHCNSRCIIIDSSNNVKINNNIIASATNIHIQMTGNIGNAMLTYNAMIDAHSQRQVNVNASVNINVTMNRVACFEWFAEVYKSTTSNSVISNNVCQGSQGAGFVRYIPKCTRSTDIIYDKNSVGSAAIGYLLFGEGSCVIAQNLTAFGCKVGILAYPKSVQLQYKNIVVIDSDIGIALRTASKTVDQTAYIRFSYISMGQRTTCTECYNQNTNNCQDTTAISMFVSTQQNKWSNNYWFSYSANLANDITQASFDAKAFIINTTFVNYKLSYTQPALASCVRNRIFMAPPTASQLIGSHHLYNTTCTNCQLGSITKYTEPLQTQFGPLKPCGQFPCTGRQNYFIQDHTGHLFTGTLIPKSQALATYLLNTTNQQCSQIPQTNAILCNSTNYTFYNLQFQSIGQDYNSRVLWPVYISTFNMTYWVQTYYDYNSYNTTSNYTTNTTNTTTTNTTSPDDTTYPYQISPDPQYLIKLNANKQWQYNPTTQLPRFTRVNRFNVLLLSNDTYNITFNSTPPRDIRFQFQRRVYPQVNRSGDWAILKVYYPVPNSIRVQVGDTVIQPITVLQNNIQDPLINLTNICGANKYYFKHRTMDFVINGNPGCRPRLTITNSIQLTAKFSMSIDDFYQMDGRTQFIDRMAALLGITDRSRIKVVGVYRGSVIVESFVDDGHVVPEDNSTTADYTQPVSDLQQLSQTLNQLYSTGAIQSTFADAGFGQVIIFNSNVRIYDTPAQPSTPDITVNINGTAVNIGLIIGIAGGAVITLVLAGCLIYMRRKNRIANQIMEMERMDLEKSEKRLAKKEEIVNNSNWSIVDLE